MTWMGFFDPSELKFQVWFDSVKFELRYKVSNMMSRVGLGLGLRTGLKDQLRLIKLNL